MFVTLRMTCVRSCCENPAEMHERFPDIYRNMTPQVTSFVC
jgi:hypothetical protein